MINHNSDDADSIKSDAKEKHRDVLESGGLGSIATAAAYATSPKWISMVLMVSLIFGGCCANVGTPSVMELAMVDSVILGVRIRSHCQVSSNPLRSMVTC
jgi:hypothetical protein